MESNLTLDKAKKLIRLREAVQQQQGILKSSKEILEAVSEAKGRVGRRQKRVVLLRQSMTQFMTQFIGLPAIKVLKIITCINTITQSIPEQHPRLISELGMLKENTKSNYSQMPNHSTCLPLETYHCHYVRKSRKRSSIWKGLVLYPGQMNRHSGECTAMGSCTKPSRLICVCVDLDCLKLLMKV